MLLYTCNKTFSCNNFLEKSKEKILYSPKYEYRYIRMLLFACPILHPMRHTYRLRASLGVTAQGQPVL